MVGAMTRHSILPITLALAAYIGVLSIGMVFLWRL
jgi:hypothetical protein